MIIQTSYRYFDAKFPLLLICPHDSAGERFFQHFPAIKQDPHIKALGPWFWRYLRIEQDYGSAALAHALARTLTQLYRGVEVTVMELDYPRAIVDGGRQTEHCIRPCLPPKLLAQLQPQLIQIHEASLAKVRAELQGTHARGGLFLDLHTMAPFTPKCFDSTNGHVELNFESLKEYVQHFIDLKNMGAKRALDLITEDGSGHTIADSHLTSLMEKWLAPHYPLAKSQPFAALPHYMMNEYMQSCAGLAIDVPKHLIAQGDGEGESLCLYSFELCQTKINRLALLLAQAIGEFFQLLPLCEPENDVKQTFSFQI